MIKKGLYFFCLLPIVFCLFLTSCKKETFITSSDATLSTVDSLKFDTVFTTVGSITQSFKINNTNDQKLRLSNVKLMGGITSPFTININGNALPEVNNIEIAANDSMYVFVTVKIDPSAASLPFIIQDSIQLQYNGNTRFVQLQAYGQNAHFLKGEIINTNKTWPNDLPYVILDSLKINESKTLIIKAGCKIYSHANAPIIVEGKLIVTGTKDEQVVFTGDRLDKDYKDLPASWPGIYFRETSNNSSLRFAVIKNAYQAIVSIGFLTAGTKVALQQCIIDNAYDAGILCIATSLNANNCLISNCGNNIALLNGGAYSLTNCTVATYGTNYITHKKPVLQVTNYIEGNPTNAIAANFTNCIFWGNNGSVKDEVFVGVKTDVPPAIQFFNCIYKVDNLDPSNATFSSSLKNQDPQFDSVDVTKRYFDFHTNLKPAPGIDSGINTPFTKDLDDNTRNAGASVDIGAYEKQ